MGRLSAEDFDAAKPALRLMVESLNKNLDESQLTVQRSDSFINMFSLSAAIEVQKLVGGDMVSVSLGEKPVPNGMPPKSLRHVVNLVNGKAFDAFGFVLAESVEKLASLDPQPVDSSHYPPVLSQQENLLGNTDSEPPMSVAV